jgi:hypothetical protein
MPASTPAKDTREDTTSDGQTPVGRQHLFSDRTAWGIGRSAANDAGRGARFLDVSGVRHGRWLDTVRRVAADAANCSMIEQRSCHGFPSRRAMRFRSGYFSTVFGASSTFATSSSARFRSSQARRTITNAASRIRAAARSCALGGQESGAATPSRMNLAPAIRQDAARQIRNSV